MPPSLLAFHSSQFVPFISSGCLSSCGAMWEWRMRSLQFGSALCWALLLLFSSFPNIQAQHHHIIVYRWRQVIQREISNKSLLLTIDPLGPIYLQNLNDRCIVCLFFSSKSCIVFGKIPLPLEDALLLPSFLYNFEYLHLSADGWYPSVTISTALTVFTTQMLMLRWVISPSI